MKSRFACADAFSVRKHTNTFFSDRPFCFCHGFSGKTLLPRGFLPPPRHGFKNRTHHPTRRRRALRSHPESLDSNHRLSPHPLHKTMSGPGEKGHSGRSGPKNPEFANSASSGGDDTAPHPPGAMKRGVRASPKSAPPSAPAGMDGGSSFVDQWIIGAHLRPAAGGPPRNPKRKADYFASVPAEERAVPDHGATLKWQPWWIR